MDKYEKAWDDIERMQAKAIKYGIAAAITSVVIWLAVLGGIGWLVVSVLRNFGWL